MLYLLQPVKWLTDSEIYLKNVERRNNPNMMQSTGIVYYKVELIRYSRSQLPKLQNRLSFTSNANDPVESWLAPFSFCSWFFLR